MSNEIINETADALRAKIASEDELRSRLENPDKNYIVSAGAGAGKTEMMSKAVLNMLNHDRELQPSQVVAITFTNAAVEELRKRINDKYRAMRKENEDFRKINTDDINVSTIHSFCSSLVRQRVFDCGLGVSPDYSEENGDEDRIVMQFIRNFLNAPENRSDFLVLREYWGNDTAHIIFDNAVSLLEIPGLDIQGEYITANPKRNSFMHDFKSCFEKIEEAAQDFTPDIKDLTQIKNDILIWKTKKSLGEMIDLAQKVSGNAEKLQQSVFAALDNVKSRLAQKPDNKKDINNRNKLLKRMDFIEKLLVQLKKYNISDSCDELINDRTACTIGFLKKMYEAIENKRSETKLDMNNILYRTAQLMKNEDAVKYFKDRYKVIFVDEFQDTDYLQLKILLAICTEGGVLRDKSIFLVGDEKQSIYRFRGAEVGFFDYVRRTYFNTEKSESCNLSMNFRSQKELIDGVNHFYGADSKFGFLLDDGDINTTDIDYHPMFTKNIPDNNEPVDDSVIVSSKMNKPVEPKTLTGLVEFISELRTKKIRLIKREDDGRVSYEIRNVRWGDILVLTSFNKEATSVYEALKKHGIPASVSGENYPGENRAIKRVCALSRYLKEMNNLHFAEVVAAFSPEGMSVISQGELTEQNGTIFDKVSKDDIEKLSDMISEVKKIYWKSGPMAALYDALEKGWLTDKKVNYISAAVELPLLYQFFEGMYTNSCDNIDRICEYADSFVAVQHKRLLNPSESTDCVRVMNLHQAKGLESNIVINYLSSYPDKEIEACEMRQIKRNHAEYITYDDGKMGIAERPKVYLSIQDIPGYARLDPEKFKFSIKYFNLFDEKTEAAYRKAENDEVIRKMYVRDTRAKVVEYNILELKEKKENKNDARTSDDNAEKNPAYNEYILKQADTQVFEFSEHYLSASPSGLEKVKTDKKSAENRQAPEPQEPSASENEIETSSDDALIISDNEDEEKKQETKQAKGGEYGTVMHRAFELYLENRKLSPTKAEASLSLFARQAIFETCTYGSGFDKYYDTVLNNLQVFVSEFAAKYGNAETAMETPIYGVYRDDAMVRHIQSSLEKNDEKIAKVNFNGKSDLIVFDDNGACIIDYKSDLRKDGESNEEYKERLRRKYLPQQKAYFTFFDSVLDDLDRKMTLYTANAGSFVWLTEDYGTDS